MQNQQKRGPNWGLLFLLLIVAGMWLGALASAYAKAGAA